MPSNGLPTIDTFGSQTFAKLLLVEGQMLRLAFMSVATDVQEYLQMFNDEILLTLF